MYTRNFLIKDVSGCQTVKVLLELLSAIEILDLIP